MRAQPLLAAGRWFWQAPYALVLVTCFFWASHVIVARYMRELPPYGLSFWRWTFSLVLLLPFTRRHLAADRRALLAAWPMMLVYGGFGVALFNVLIYLGLHFTTAVNAAIIQSNSPLFTLAWSFLLFRDRPTGFQVIGIALSVIGVLIVATGADLSRLLALRFNPGDLIVAASSATYALYTATLRKRPAVHPLSFLTATILIGDLLLLPAYLAESAQGAPFPVTPGAILAVVFTGLAPGLLGYLFYNRGVELIGANRAAPFNYTIPLMSVAMAVVFLHEQPQPYHLVAGALIVAGVVLTTRRPRAALARS